ncbi:MAG: putative maltokinase, partial [Candidatus Competibacter sp.]|nr:putative maltokinase [Candidatus Competibacter sp.]
MKRLIAVRRASKAFGRGRLIMLLPGNRKILAYLREHEEEIVLCVANLSRTAQPVELDLGAYRGLVPVELLGQTAFPPINEVPYLLTLHRYGFYWFRLSQTAAPVWHEDKRTGRDLPVLVLFQGWNSFFPDLVEPRRRKMAGDLHERLVGRLLPEFLPTQRWFAGKGGKIEKVEFERHDVWPDRSEWLLARIHVWLEGQPEPQYYALPLALAWEEENDEKLRPLLPGALARVRARARMGLLYGAFADEKFCQNLVAMMAQGARIAVGPGRLRAFATRLMGELAGDAPQSLPAKRLASDSSNTSIAIGDRLLMKVYRRLQSGINPELEMGRFLTESGFRNIAPLAGAIEYEGENGDRTALVMLQGFVENQGDAWTYTQDYLKRFLDDCLQEPEKVRQAGDEVHALYRIFATTLGQRTGELHRALARATGDPAFDPEPITADDLADWLSRIRAETVGTFERLERKREALSEPARLLAERLLEARGALLACLERTDRADPEALKIRYHGDYHLAQVLVAKDDVIIIDFEGEPSRSLEERRGKHSPLRDVVGMLRSFNYAAHAALRQFVAEQPTLAPAVDDWQRRTRAAFLNGYAEATRDSAGFHIDSAQAAMLLRAFTLEKACYELRYELDNRPDWVEIPLGGLCELLPVAESAA